MILDGEENQTDFKLNAPGAGPMGERQTSLIDPNLTLRYRLLDALNLMPRMAVRHTLLTVEGEPGVTHLITSRVAPTMLIEQKDEFHIPLTLGEEGPKLVVKREEGIVRRRDIVSVPSEQRDREAGMSGQFQVVLVRIKSGEWQQDVPVTYEPWPYILKRTGDEPTVVQVPGAQTPLRLTLGRTAKPMPVAVRLDEFEATPYQGGQAAAGFAMRDFASQITIFKPDQTERQAKVQLNDPAFVEKDRGFLPSQSWLLYQASWDPNNQAFTVLGVGNRPHFWTMVAGFALTVVGLAWAFYLKPVLIRRAKAKALKEHRERQATGAQPVLVPSAA
jgi:hypothetical protein